MTMTPTRIYLAGASKEIERCEALMAKLREHGHAITMDWCAAIRAAGEATPADEMVCRVSAANDYNGVAQCEFFWLVVPEGASNGAWTELGLAIAFSKQTIVSGSWEKSIFCRLTHRQFQTHEEALSYLCSK